MKFAHGSRRHGFACVPVLLVLLSACAQSRVVREPPPSAKTIAALPRQTQATPRPVAAPARTPLPEGSTHYTVRAGDTVYGIAFRANLNFRDLAAWNGIAEPYVIRIGQRLRLLPPATTVAAGATATSPPTPARDAGVAAGRIAEGRAIVAGKSPAPGPATPDRDASAGVPAVVAASPKTTTASRPEAGSGNAPGMPAAAAPSMVEVDAGTAGITSAASSPPLAVVPPAPIVASQPTAHVGSPSWRWPASGPLIGRFVAGDQTQQGINIAGSAGQPVAAAADGVVVYSGSGLVGYGELIIVKHSNEWLSAYAHNRRRLVAEGVAVKAGQVIAELGRSGAARDMLHFEIRRNGKPVDPLLWLPAR